MSGEEAVAAGDNSKGDQLVPQSQSQDEQMMQTIELAANEDADQSSQSKKKGQKCDTTNYTDYQRVWILICLDRGRTLCGLDSDSKIDQHLHSVVCGLLQVESKRAQINRRPCLSSLKHIWKSFIENKVVSKPKNGGAKQKPCREQVEALLKQNLSFRQIAKQLKPEINISASTVGRISEEMKKREAKRPRKSDIKSPTATGKKSNVLNQSQSTQNQG